MANQLVWKKLGIIYSSLFDNSWRHSSALTPVPILLSTDIIRVFCSFRDSKGVGRIGYIDVSSHNPSNILSTSLQPSLDIGLPGNFDDNGLILGDIIPFDGQLRLYYVGFQIPQKAKFLAFTGLAVSTDNGQTFTRFTNAPILDRTDGCLFTNAIHSVIFDKGHFRCWCGAGDSWNTINDKVVPSYRVTYNESTDGFNFNNKAFKVHIPYSEFSVRIGRPRVYKLTDRYLMLFTYGSSSGLYSIGSAFSPDGYSWTIQNDFFGLSLGGLNEESELSYPSLIRFNETIYVFYNGDDMGRSGLHCAVLESGHSFLNGL